MTISWGPSIFVNKPDLNISQQSDNDEVVTPSQAPNYSKKKFQLSCGCNYLIDWLIQPICWILTAVSFSIPCLSLSQEEIQQLKQKLEKVEKERNELRLNSDRLESRVTTQTLLVFRYSVRKQQFIYLLFHCNLCNDNKFIQQFSNSASVLWISDLRSLKFKKKSEFLEK